MEMKEFTAKVRSVIENRLGEGYSVEVKEVRKNNGVMLHGLTILTPGRNVAPTLYLEHFWRAYREGMTFGTVIDRLMEIYGRDVPPENVDMEFFKDFEKVRDRICYRLVGNAGNREFLKNVPHVEFLDLAVCFFYAYKGEVLGEGSIPVCNSHMQMWGTGVAELMKLAEHNTARLFPWQCSTMEEVLRELLGDKSREILADGEIPMKILSNSKRIQGAVCMIYRGVLEKMAEELGDSLYILPSSVHEVILLAQHSVAPPEELKDMIVQVNRTHVAPEEVLSDSLYRYDRFQKRVEKVL